MNKQFDDLIHKHLEGTLIEEEKEQLRKMLTVPENLLYLSSKIDEKFFDQSLEEAGDDEMGSQIFQRIGQRINEDRFPQAGVENDAQSSKVFHLSWYKRKMFRWTAVAAASIIIVISFAVLLENKKSDDPTAIVQKDNKSIDSSIISYHNEINKSGKEKRFQLPDGTMIVLANQSEISYYEPFRSIREITLKGKAYFKVAKDKIKPFVVISGDISTTALGTEFTVTAYENETSIRVRLYEGKVVVKPVMKSNRKLKNDIYLLPGQEFIYGSSARVRKFKLVGTVAPEAIMNNEIERDDPSIPHGAKGSWYMFNNQSLEQVLDQLSEMYNVPIVFDRQSIQKIYFTGKYDRSDSLEFILQDIGTPNKLTITKTENGFIISK